MDWIAVTDRLPEEAERVLVCWNDSFTYIGWRIDGLWFYKDSDGFKDQNITHWMPLPSPPKAREI